MKKLAVYCGASLGKDSAVVTATKKLGQYLAMNHIDLVYGGGRVGLMGILANQVLDLGGNVYGIIPNQLADRGAALERLTDLTIVENMSVRKQKMLDLSDGCLALPGGPGTLEEIIEAFSWARLGNNNNPCVFYNIDGYYDELKKMFDTMTAHGYLTEEDRQKLLFSDSLEIIFDFMNNYIPPKIRKY
ncbi:lysine decarboxylase [Leuconostoc mesenteroides subsp. dextranicum]|uniref:LOG family protein n=1 Tax=Leuconostoc mesenteroides TaxID=1245 RepID=UPI000680B9D2|nr:TIGR00730 family Rossman fold protein [Leuconostoc mesenteroides]KMY81010.1 lysine decarboxylase [Leuconostoc mesenteroides subsp. dextranicum]